MRDTANWLLGMYSTIINVIIIIIIVIIIIDTGRGKGAKETE